MSDDALESAGLTDLVDGNPARARLLARCLELGLTPAEIREAGDALVEIAVQRLYSSGTELKASEVAERSGLPVDRLLQIARSAGLTDSSLETPLWSEDDVELMRALAAAEELLGADAVMQVLRVAGQSIARIGDAAISTFLTSTGAPALRDDESGLELLEANAGAASLLPTFGEWLGRMLTRYIRSSYRPMSELFVAAATDGGVDRQQLAIGFADLVESTGLADHQSLAELSTALDAFERTAFDTVVRGGGRVVKFIGDEVMFRVEDVSAACGIGLELVRLVRDDPRLPALRVGIAAGDVLGREGDYFGPVVNLAARVTKVAPPDGVVATRAAASSIDESAHLDVEALGAIEMRGFSDPVELVRLTGRSP